MISRVKYLTATLGFLVLPNLGFAQWGVEVEGPDVFGETEVSVFGEVGPDSFLIFRCKTGEEVLGAWLIESDWGDDFRPLEATIILRSDTGRRLELASKVSPWNDNYVAIMINDWEAVLDALRLVGGANSTIDTGFDVPQLDWKYSESISARGSTRTKELFFEKCDLPKAKQETTDTPSPDQT